MGKLSMEDKFSMKETGMAQLLKRGRERKGRNTCEGCNFESTKEMKFTPNLAKHSYSPALNTTPIRPQYSSNCSEQQKKYFILGKEMYFGTLTLWRGCGNKKVEKI